jgi:hypothetical protein
MLDICSWLHETLETLPLIRYRFEVDALPANGVYFLYEEGERWGHGSEKPRIVRVGTHRDGNFRSRIAEHFLFNESKMHFDEMQPRPSDRSIFRKHIGRALLNSVEDPYLEVWDPDLIRADKRRLYAPRRNLAKEKELELAVTHQLRKRFSFRYLSVDNQAERMGVLGLETACIGTFAGCTKCQPSESWLGKSSPDKRISNGKLWNVHHLRAPGLTAQQQDRLRALIAGIPVVAR